MRVSTLPRLDAETASRGARQASELTWALLAIWPRSRRTALLAKNVTHTRPRAISDDLRGLQAAACRKPSQEPSKKRPAAPRVAVRIVSYKRQA